jgi:hypothetical protein
LKAWLVTRGYRIDVETDESFLAVRPDLPSIEHPGPQASGCFPSV